MKTIAIALAVAACIGLASCGSGSTAVNNTASENAIETSGSTGSDLVYCEVVEQRVAREDCEDLDRARDQVREGTAAFNVPNPMHRGESETVQLFIDRRPRSAVAALDAASDSPANWSVDENAMEAGNMTVDSSGNAVDGGESEVGNRSGPVVRPQDARPTPKQQARQLGGRTEEMAPAVGRFMRATLEGNGFRIVPLSSALQEIPRDGQASWLWQVTALEGGVKTLTLTTVVMGRVGNRTYPLVPTQEVRQVTVGVRWYDRLRDWLTALPGWIKLITAVVAALGALAGAWFGLKSKFKPAATPDDEAVDGNSEG